MDNNPPSTNLTDSKTTIFQQEQTKCCLCWYPLPSWCCCLVSYCWPCSCRCLVSDCWPSSSRCLVSECWTSSSRCLVSECGTSSCHCLVSDCWTSCCCCWPIRCCKQVTYRIPALIYISDVKTYLAFAEKRITPRDTDADLLVMKTGEWKDDKSTVEWDSNYTELTSAHPPGRRCMNPCPVYEKNSKTLFLFFICVPIGVSEGDQIKSKKNQAQLHYITSQDTGKTWKGPIDLKEVIGEKEKNWATFAVGPGHGVQLKSGRLIVPAYAYYFDSTNEEPTSHAFTFYSDDNGRTWSTGDLIKDESNECQVAEIIDDSDHSTLYCNAKSKSGKRVEALSRSSKGQEFDKTFQMAIDTASDCQGSVLKIQNPDKSTWLLYSHPTDKNKRKNLGIYVNKSPSDLKQWNLKDTINDGPSGYSDLAECANTEYIACLMECGETIENEEIAFKFVKISGF